MMKRKIVEIDESKCNGCGLCVPACHEGAIEIIDGKARLVDDKFCDGIGDCLGECPEDAINIIEREAGEYDEVAVQKRMLAAENDKVNKAEAKIHTGGCPGTRMMDLRFDEDKDNRTKEEKSSVDIDDIEIKIKSQLKQWPVQLKLVSENAPYFDGAELLLTADCVPIAYPDYHLKLLKGKAVAMGCPKLDDNQYYIEKLSSIIKNNDIKSITAAYMEVPCCTGLLRAAELAVDQSGKDIPINKVKIGISGNVLES
ncbi:MAG: ATP-binding protein [Halanaerobiaceae bacterium]